MSSLSMPPAWPGSLPEATPPSDMAIYQLPTGIAAHVRAQPWFARSPYRAAGTASEQLDASGYDRGRLRGVLITHSHWDHVSGLDQLRVPIWTNAGELRYAAEARDGTVFRAVSEGHEIHGYEFGDTPYLGFPSSYDVHGDGSVVVAWRAGTRPAR